MRKWLWSLSFICFFFFLIYTMPTCLGCKKEFKARGFQAHKKSCRPYKREIKARLTNVLDSDLVADPSNETATLDDTNDLGIVDDMLLDDVPVCNGEINDPKKKTNSTVDIGARERAHASSGIPKIRSSASPNKAPKAVPGYTTATPSGVGGCCPDH